MNSNIAGNSVIPPEVAQYLERARSYWKQGSEHWARGEREKATELAWGSVVEALKALALTGGQRLRTHGEVRQFVRNLAHRHADPELYRLFSESEAAHSNFYEGFMDELAVKEVLLNLERFLQKIGGMLPE